MKFLKILNDKSKKVKVKMFFGLAINATYPLALPVIYLTIPLPSGKLNDGYWL